MALKRMQLFEFEDFQWFPGWLRECLTNYLLTVHRFLDTPALLRPILERLLQQTGSDSIVDLCSGAGGPMPSVCEGLTAPEGPLSTITLTDKYPNLHAAGVFNGQGGAIRYLTTSVDAGAVPKELAGVRTMIGSFHHMPEPVARQILKDAFIARRPFCLYELSDNSSPRALWWLAVPFNTVMVVLATPFVRPFTFQQFFFTYVIPVLPFVIAWDGATSNARTYTPDDLRELTRELVAPDYAWEIGVTRKKGYPGNASYLLGIPAHRHPPLKTSASAS